MIEDKTTLTEREELLIQIDELKYQLAHAEAYIKELETTRTTVTGF